MLRFLSMLILCSITLPAAAADLHVGVATIDITPPVPYRMSGYFTERLSTGIHDPLLAKAIVLKQGRTRAALVFCDLIGISGDITGKARRLASEKTRIPISNILIAATHTHLGPLFWGAMRKHFHDQALAKFGNDPHEVVDYPAVLAERLAQVIASADASARSATLHVGKAEQQGISFNRRFHMKDGTVRFNPGKLNPDIVRVAGPIDPEVGILLAQDPKSSQPFAGLTVFACHLDTVGGTEYGADYPYYLEKTLRGKFGADFISLFGTGTCGDINHVDVSHNRPQKGQAEAERIGTTLGQTVLAMTPSLRTIDKPSLAVRSQTLMVPTQQYSEEEIAQARQDMFKIGTRELPFLEQVRANKITSLALLGKKEWPLEVQVFRLSDDTAIVGLPGEVFVELGLAIKQASPFKNTFVVELANDSPAYVPTRKAFIEGSYEVVNSRVASGGGEMLVEAAIRMLRELAR